MIQATSYHGFGGAFAVACKHVGITLNAVIEPEGFGVGAVEANRDFLGFHGPIIKEKLPEPIGADLVLGNPPCSGFSGLNVSKGENARGPRSPINQCMWDLVTYAATVNPKMVIFESVQGAGTAGHALMLELVQYLRDQTDEPWQLTSTFMSGATVGAAQIRRRYFFVAHRIPFGVMPPPVERVITYEDAIGDLQNLQTIKDPQPYDPDAVPSPWASGLLSPTGMVTDMHLGNSVWERRMASIAKYITSGETQRQGVARAIEAGELDESWDGQDINHVIHGDYFSEAIKIHPDGAGRVVTGSGGVAFIHWSQPRTLTVRETARLMGFPDQFDWGFCSGGRAFMYLGKQVPVQSWEWILTQAAAALNDDPFLWRGSWTGTNWHVDITNDYKAVYHERTRQQPVDARSDALIREMANRPPYSLPEPKDASKPAGSAGRPKRERIQRPPRAPRIRATRPFRPVDPGLGELFQQTVDGVTIEMRGGTLDQYCLNEVLERRVYTRFAQLNEDDVWADIGGHIGTFSALIAPKVRKVIAFEPDASNAAMFRRNMELNEIANVKLYEAAAVADDRELAEFFLNTGKNTGAHSQFITRGRTKIVVPAVNLPEKLVEHGVTKIKMDCEGGELALVPAIDWSRIKEVHLEFHVNALKDKDYSLFTSVVNTLKANFTFVVHDTGKLSWTTLIHASHEMLVDTGSLYRPKELHLA